ncbi:hypothetical protein [Uruburuella suis]|uniref:hypothetical protein n=1 Tax=Uruburuella suis TaxID=252130 RepID=UPI003F4AA642
MSKIEIYLNVHQDGWVCVSVGCPVGDDERWAVKWFDGTIYTPVDVWCAMREHTPGTVNGCLFAAEVAAARGRRKKEIAASALLDAVAEKLKGKKEEAT